MSWYNIDKALQCSIHFVILFIKKICYFLSNIIFHGHVHSLIKSIIRFKYSEFVEFILIVEWMMSALFNRFLLGVIVSLSTNWNLMRKSNFYVFYDCVIYLDQCNSFSTSLYGAERVALRINSCQISHKQINFRN